jgi:two-component system cell cycle response regulator
MVKKPVPKSEDELRKQITELQRENDHLKSLLLIDELTGLYNKRFFCIQLEVETARTRRTGQSCTLMVMDVDNFKLVNDTYGHDAGDRFLMHIAEIVKKDLRPTDFACRFGGDEFSVIMPSSTLNDSFSIAKRIQTSVAKLASALYTDLEQPLTTSFGLATYEEHTPMNVDTFFKQADLELYEAKKAGKNQISFGRVKRIETTVVSAEEKAALVKLMPKIR